MLSNEIKCLKREIKDLEARLLQKRGKLLLLKQKNSMVHIQQDLLDGTDKCMALCLDGTIISSLYRYIRRQIVATTKGDVVFFYARKTYKEGSYYCFLNEQGTQISDDYEDVYRCAGAMFHCCFSSSNNEYDTLLFGHTDSSVQVIRQFNSSTRVAPHFTHKDKYDKLDVAVVKENGLLGGVNVYGKTVMPFEYEVLYNTRIGNENYFLAKKHGGNFNYLNSKNQVIYHCEKNSVPQRFVGEYGVVKVKKDTFNIINTKGHLVSEHIRYASVSIFTGHYMKACDISTGRCGVVDIRSNKVIVPFLYHINCISLSYKGKTIRASLSNSVGCNNYKEYDFDGKLIYKNEKSNKNAKRKAKET